MFNVFRYLFPSKKTNPFSSKWSNRKEAVVMIKEWMFAQAIRHEYLSTVSGVEFAVFKRFLNNKKVWNKNIDKIWEGARMIHDDLTK